MGQLIERFKRKGVRLVAGLLIVLVFALHAVGVWTLPGMNVLERNLYDMRTHWTFPGGVDERVVILDIDEKSLAEFGRWPWNRARMAKITKQLVERDGVAALGFDVVWAEPETEQWKALLADSGVSANSAAALSGIDTDRIFAESLKAGPSVLGYYFTNEDKAVSKNVLPQSALTVADLPADASRAANWNGYTGNIAALMDGGMAGGHTNSLRDVDGVIRRVPMLIRHNDKYYESLSLAMVRKMLGGEPVQPVIVSEGGYNRVEALMIGPMRVPVDDELAAFVPFRGPSYSFRYIPLGDVLAGRVPQAELAGKIALIGTSAPGLGDNRATAADEIMPGVEVHANMIAGILDQAIREQPAYTVGLDLAQVLLLGLLAVVIFAVTSPAKAFVSYLAMMGVAVAINLAAWANGLLVLPLASVLMTLTALYVFTTAWGYFVEGRAKRQLGEIFGQYVPPGIVEEMAKNPGNYSMVGRDADLTVLFADLRGFTTISENLTAPELAEYINEYLTRMSTVIANNKGTLDKFIGDAIMAFWGAPVDDPDAARNAVKAAIEMYADAKLLSAEMVARGRPPLEIGAGVNTGPMRVGDMGSKLRRAYTVMGDAVNLGSRLEGLTKVYGVGVIVGEGTAHVLPDFLFRRLDRVRVKGKEQPVDIFEPIGLKGEVAADIASEVAIWNEMTDAWFAGKLDEAEGLLERNQAAGGPQVCGALYAERIAEYRLNPPAEGADMVTNFKTK